MAVASRTEDRFGELAALAATTYTIVGAAVPANTKWNLLISMTNRLGTAIKVRLFIADTTWTTGLPAGSTLKAAIAFDLQINPGDVIQIAGIVMKATEKLIAYADTASGLDITANGVAIL